MSSPRRRPVRRRGHRRQPGGWQTARRWSPAHYLTRATGAQLYHRRDHKRSRPAEGLDRWRTATVICGSTRGVDKVRDGAQVVRERLVVAHAVVEIARCEVICLDVGEANTDTFLTAADDRSGRRPAVRGRGRDPLAAAPLQKRSRAPLRPGACSWCNSAASSRRRRHRGARLLWVDGFREPRARFATHWSVSADGGLTLALLHSVSGVGRSESTESVRRRCRGLTSAAAQEQPSRAGERDASFAAQAAISRGRVRQLLPAEGSHVIEAGQMTGPGANQPSEKPASDQRDSRSGTLAARHRHKRSACPRASRCGSRRRRDRRAREGHGPVVGSVRWRSYSFA